MIYYPSMYIYYSNLYFLNDILIHRSPPFLRALYPNTCVINIQSVNYLYIDIDNLFKIKYISECSERIKNEFRAKLVSSSITNNRISRTFFNTEKIDYIWDRTNGVAISFSSSFFNEKIKTFDCKVVNYHSLNEKLKDIDLISLDVDRFYSIIMNSINNCLDPSITARIQIIDNLESDLIQYNNSLFEIHWENVKKFNGYMDQFNIFYFVIGPNFKISKETFKIILSYYGINIPNSDTNNCIRKLSLESGKFKLDFDGYYDNF